MNFCFMLQVYYWFLFQFVFCISSVFVLVLSLYIFIWYHVTLNWLLLAFERALNGGILLQNNVSFWLDTSFKQQLFLSYFRVHCFQATFLFSDFWFLLPFNTNNTDNNRSNPKQSKTLIRYTGWNLVHNGNFYLVEVGLDMWAIKPFDCQTL